MNFFLITVVYFTIADTKIMGTTQRRRRPNVVGYIGFLQLFANSLKFVINIPIALCLIISLVIFLFDNLNIVYQLIFQDFLDIIEIFNLLGIIKTKKFIPRLQRLLALKKHNKPIKCSLNKHNNNFILVRHKGKIRKLFGHNFVSISQQKSSNFTTKPKTNNSLSIFSFFLIATCATWSILFQPVPSNWQVCIIWLVVCLLAASVIFLENYITASFSFLFFTLFLLFLYVLPNAHGKASIFAYLFYFLFFFTYHSYFTFTETFFTRVKFILNNYYIKSEWTKIFLWLFLVFLPSLMTPTFIILGVLYPILLNSFLASQSLIFYSILSICLWIVFLGISSKNKVFRDSRANLLSYFSREACIDFVGNNFGSRFVKNLENVQAPLLRRVAWSVLGVITTTGVAPSIFDANTVGTSAAKQIKDSYTGNDLYKSYYEQRKAYQEAVIHAYPQVGSLYLKTCIYLGFPTDLDYSEYQKRLPHYQAEDKDLVLINTDKYEQAKVNINNLCEGWKKQAEKLDTDQLRKAVKKFAILLKEKLKKNDSVFHTPEDIEKATREDLLPIYRYFISEIEMSMLDQSLEINHSEENYILTPFEDTSLGSSSHSESSNMNLERSEIKNSVAKNSSDEAIDQDLSNLTSVPSFADDQSQSSPKRSHTTLQNTDKEEPSSSSTELIKDPKIK
jgi:hypothetical protein